MTARRIASGALAHARAFLGRENGVSAVEFALLAPILVFAVLAMLDLGLALYERMTMDRLLRGGAQAAMSDPGRPHVIAVIEASAEDEFDFEVDRYCACRVDLDAVVDPCTCADGSQPAIFYKLEAARDYPGMVLPSIALGAETKVRVR